MDELSKKFPQFSFGILTGDNKQNPEADVLVMTTEIYLNTLKKMSFLQENPDEANKIQLDFNIDIQNELGCVVFDEVHYINDGQRFRMGTIHYAYSKAHPLVRAICYD